MKLNPVYAPAHQWYAAALLATGRSREALASIRRARALDPLSPILATGVGYVPYMSRQYAAGDAYREVLAQDLRFLARLGLGMTYSAFGEPLRAIAENQAAMERLPQPHPTALALLGHAYGVAGRRREALGILESLRASARQRYVPAEGFALVQLGLGDHGAVMTSLELAYENRSSSMVYLRNEPVLHPLRADPRFTRLLGTIAMHSDG